MIPSKESAQCFGAGKFQISKHNSRETRKWKDFPSLSAHTFTAQFCMHSLPEALVTLCKGHALQVMLGKPSMIALAMSREYRWFSVLCSCKSFLPPLLHLHSKRTERSLFLPVDNCHYWVSCNATGIGATLQPEIPLSREKKD